MKAAQLPLDIAGAPSFHRDDLVVTPANASAAAFIDGWPGWPGPVALLLGPEGAGKSHLAQVWREKSRAIELRGNALLVDQFEASEHYVLEDIDRTEISEETLFHLLNAVRQNGKTLLLTSRRPLAGLPITLPDLASRLRAADIAQLEAPDDGLLEGVMRKLVADRQLSIDEQTLRYLVTRMERSLAAAGELVDALDRAALTEQRPITRPLAARVLEENQQTRLSL